MEHFSASIIVIVANKNVLCVSCIMRNEIIWIFEIASYGYYESKITDCSIHSICIKFGFRDEHNVVLRVSNNIQAIGATRYGNIFRQIISILPISAPNFDTQNAAIFIKAGNYDTLRYP